MTTDTIHSWWRSGRNVAVAVVAVTVLSYGIAVVLGVDVEGYRHVPTTGPVLPGGGDPATMEFPDASSTGVPAGVELSPYTGPCKITRPGTVIDAKTVSCSLVIQAPAVIKRSFVDGPIVVDGERAGLRIEDSEVDGGDHQIPAVGYMNLTIVRADIHGGQTSVNCSRNCYIEGSWLHGQHLPAEADWHLDGFLSNGGSYMTLVGNTLACEAPNNAFGGGCTAAAALFGDFAKITHVTVDQNLFVASGQMPYCLYAGSDELKPHGGDARHIRITNNVFQRGATGQCAAYGAWTSFDQMAEGSVWSGNVWDDGEPLAVP